MKIERFVLAVLAVWGGVLGGSRVFAQGADPMLPPAAVQSAPVVDTSHVVDTSPGGVPATLMPGPGHYDVPGVTNWIRHDHPCSCNDMKGWDGDVGYEVYFHAGPSIPVGTGTVLSRNCEVGMTLEGGFHTLFFDKDNSRAWLVDVGVVTSWNSGGAVMPKDPFTMSVLVPNNTTGAFQRMSVTDTIRGVNRTFLNLGLGREWFFGGDGTSTTAHWRAGVDAGGRYGTESMTFDLELKHRTDVIGGAYAGAHVDYEYPWYDLLLQVGFRVEYAYTWSDILQRATDMSEINLLVTAGVRF